MVTGVFCSCVLLDAVENAAEIRGILCNLTDWQFQVDTRVELRKVSCHVSQCRAGGCMRYMIDGAHWCLR